MSKNILQVYTDNPITTNQGTDLMYFGRSPYGTGDDTAMLFSNFAQQFGAPYTPSALTKLDDTNVTLTLGGTPATALLQAVSLTLGWTGQLGVTRGGTGLGSFNQGDMIYASAANTLTALAKNTSATRYISNTGTNNDPAWAQVDLSNGVTGNLPVTNLNSGTGASASTYWRGDGTWATPTDTGVPSITGTANQVLANGTSGTPQSGAVTLTTPQDIATTSSPTFNNLTLTGGTIFDVNGNESVTFQATASAVNYLNIINSATGVAVSVIPAGSDTDIQLNLWGKGAGAVALLSTGTTAQQFMFTGAGYQHTTQFNYPSSAASRSVTWQDASGTVAFLSDITGGGITWANVTGTSQAMAINTGYIANNAGLVTMTLPSTAAVGTVLAVAGNGAGGWSIAQNASQNIQIGNVSSTVGTGGSVASTNRYDSLNLVCTVANTTWVAVGGPQSSGLTIT